jgi:hypothetical protein
MTAPPFFRTSDPLHSLTIRLSERMFRTLEGMAAGAGRSTGLQAQLLFDAAFSARCKPTGDVALDAAVAAIDAAGGSCPEPARDDPAPVTVPQISKPPEPKPPTAREAQHAAIVARARLTSPAPRETVKEDPAKPVAPATEENDHGSEASPEEPAQGSESVATEPGGTESQSEGGGIPASAGCAETAGGEPPLVVRTPDAAPDASAPAGCAPAAAPAPAGVTDRPPITAATLKYMRMLKSIGNSPAEIADMVGLPADDVRDALAGKR